MRNFIAILVVLALIAVIVGTLYLSHGFVTTFAIGTRNVEFVLRVVDADSSKPISAAIITIRSEEFKEKGLVRDHFKLVTDSDGRARMFREDHPVEDVIRSFRKTVTLVNTTWCGLSVQAKGYEPLQDQWLAAMKYEDQGHFRNEMGDFQRIEFTVALVKQ